MARDINELILANEYESHTLKFPLILLYRYFILKPVDFLS